MRFAAYVIISSGWPFASTGAQEGCPAPTGTFVATEGARLHVIDWGGSGEPIIFLSGLFGSAHTFDEFAPLFTDRHRSIGITRRGIAPSDTSGANYSAAHLTADILTVMDSLRISAAHVVGWSFGGNEATLLAVAKPQRVLSLTLLDSYDRAARRRAADPLRTLTPPPFLPFDSSSPLALQWREQRLGNRPPPLSFTCTSNKFTADGRYIGSVVSAPLRDSIAAAMRKGMPPLPYSDVRQPVLAVFAVPRAVADRYPAYGAMSPRDREVANALFTVAALDMTSARDRMRRDIPHARVIGIPGAAHDIFRSHPEAVFMEMRKFLAVLPKKGP